MMAIRLRPVWLSIALAACTAFSDPGTPALSVQDLPGRNVIRITNSGNAAVRLYHPYLRHFGPLQMFFVRFRDRNNTVFDIDGAPDGWFTPRVHYASFDRIPRRRLVIPANRSLDFPRELTIYFAGATRWAGARDTGPCEVQIKLAGWLDNDPQRPIEAVSDWRPGPCPM